MKKRILYILGIIAVLGCYSCSEDFMNTFPTDAISEQDAYATTSSVYAALNGIHRSMYIQYNSNQDQCGEGSMMIQRDVRGEDLVLTGTSSTTTWYFSDYRWEAHRNVLHRTPLFSWEFYYRVMANANKIITNVDEAVGPEEERRMLKAQALTYRAWCHFNLVQLFAGRYDAASVPNEQPGVPVMTSNVLDGLPRSTVEEVYDQINADLREAMTHFKYPGVEERMNKSHIDLSVARGVKARVALTMQQWDTAAYYAHEARAGYDLMTNAQYTSGFNDYTNPEWMWGCHVIEDQTTYFYSFFAFMSANFASTHIRSYPKAINQQLYDSIPATDIRKTLWSPTGDGIPVPPNGAKRPYINKKFLSISSSDSRGDVPYMRAGEMYLIEAEALARAGDEAGAKAVFDELMLNRNPSWTSTSRTGQAFIDQIMIHRRIELWGEGFRFTDLKRLNIGFSRPTPNHTVSICRVVTMDPGDPEWQFLIPQAEIDANKNIVQNP